MDQLWKWVMHLNAKVFCLLAALFFIGVSLWCGWEIMHPREPIKDGLHTAKPPELAPAWSISTLDFVSNQLTAETLTIPVDPFRPTIEAIFTNETERAAFLKALKAAQNAAAGLTPSTAGAKKEDPFAHLRKKDAVPGGLVGPNGQPMIVPKLTFMGFFQRPDGTQAAMFYDSAENTTFFYEAGKQVHGVDILEANVREAKIRLPDGSVTSVPIGTDIELAAEPSKTPPKKAAVAAKPGVPQKAVPQKPGQQKGALQKGVQQKGKKQKP